MNIPIIVGIILISIFFIMILDGILTHEDILWLLLGLTLFGLLVDEDLYSHFLCDVLLVLFGLFISAYFVLKYEETVKFDKNYAKSIEGKKLKFWAYISLFFFIILFILILYIYF